MGFENVINSMRSGKPIILLDDPKREGEADFLVHAKFCKPEMIRMMRKDGGGLICLATDGEVANKLGIELMAKRMAAGGLPTYQKLAITKTPYGDMPSFAIYINHRKTYTGVTDKDRSLTVTEFAKMLNNKKSGQELQDEFGKNFYAPGHIPLLIGSDLNVRKGHTELGIEIARMAEMSPAVVMCEMLSDDGNALSWKEAKDYASANGYFAIEGKELLNLMK